MGKKFLADSARKYGASNLIWNNNFADSVCKID